MNERLLKGTVQRDFRLSFFSSFEPAWATDPWVKIASLLVGVSPSYSNFSIEKTDYAQYHTVRSQNKFHPRTMVQKLKM